MSKTPDQQRATHAWEVVKKMLIVYPHTQPPTPNAKRVPDPHAKQFGGAARKLPVRIMASGLGQALAFLTAKGKTPELLLALSDWVLNRPATGAATWAAVAFPPRPRDRAEEQRQQALAKERGEALLNSVVTGTADDMRMNTAEALAYLQWLNRFCEAEDLHTETEGT